MPPRNVIPALMLAVLVALSAGSVRAQVDSALVGVNFNRFTDQVHQDTVRNQLKPNLCWASAINMVLKYHDLKVTQLGIAVSLYPDTANLTANDSQMQEILNRQYIGNDGKKYQSKCWIKHGGEDMFKALLSQLQAQQPVIICIRSKQKRAGHAYVLVQMAYRADEYNNKIPLSLYLIDPWPFNPIYKQMSWGEFYNSAISVFRVDTSPVE